MLQILGIGAGYPDTALDNAFLSDLGGQVSFARWGVESRGSCLAPGWIRETKNRDPWAAHHVSTIRPTDLSLRAARAALERAGIEPEEIVVSVGDIVTPWESTPAEGQRVASRLGLKIPAYDITVGPGALSLHMHLISQWKEERQVGPILSVSANVPTQFVAYEGGVEREILGDGACAVICSSVRRGRLTLRKTAVRVVPERRGAVGITTFGYAKIDTDFIENVVPELVRAELRTAFAEDGLQPTGTIFIGPQLSLPLLESVAGECGVPLENTWSNIRSRGYQLGASEFSVLADKWQELSSGMTVLIVSVGSGGIVSRCILDVV